MLPEAQPDPTKYFVLSTTSAPSAPAEGTTTIALRPIELAAYLDAPALVVRRGVNEVEFRDFARWGEPLERGIARVLREELLARGAAGSVTIAGGRRHDGADLELRIRVLACEGSADGEVLFRAVWELAKPGEPREIVARGNYRASDVQWDGTSEGSLAAGLSEAVAGLAAEIAGAVKK